MTGSGICPLVRTAVLPLCLAATLMVQGACAQNSGAKKHSFVKSGDAYAQAGKISEALIEYRNAVQADPMDGDARLKLADMYWQKRDAAAAIPEYIRAADLLPNRIDVQIRAGNLLLMAGSFEDAKMRAQKALKLQATNADALVLLANAMAGLRDFDAAVRQLEEAVRIAPDRGATFASLGAIENQRGRSDAAERAYRKATEVDGASSSAHLALANFYWSQGRFNEAEGELRKTLALDPENTLAHRAMAVFALTQNRPAEAEQHLLKLRDLTRSADAAFALADFYLQRGNSTAARKVLEPLAANPDTGSDAIVRLALLDHAAGRRQQAYDAIARVLKTSNGHLGALVSQSAMLLWDARLDDALASAERAVQMNPGSAEGFFMVARVQLARKQQGAAVEALQRTLQLNPRATSAQIMLAQLRLSDGRVAESTALAEDALRTNKSDGSARLMLVRALIAQQDFARAEAELAQLSPASSKSAAVHNANAAILLHKKLVKEAQAEFEQALRLDPRSTDAVEGLATIDLDAGRAAAAVSRVTEYANRPDANPQMMMAAVRTYLATRDTSRAEAMLRWILAKDPSYLDAYLALGQLYVTERRLDAALAEFDNLAQLNVRSVEAVTIAGMILQAQGRNAAARERFERALQIDPSAPVAANNLAWMLAEAGGDLTMALQLAQTAKRGLPDAPEVNDTLGMIYLKKDLATLAVRTLQSAVDKSPADPVFRYHLAMALAKAGDASAARQHLRRALSSNSGFDGSSDARALLKALEAQ